MVLSRCFGRFWQKLNLMKGKFLIFLAENPQNSILKKQKIYPSLPPGAHFGGEEIHRLCGPPEIRGYDYVEGCDYVQVPMDQVDSLFLFFQTHFWSVTHTTLQSMLNAKVSLHRFWRCHENGLIKTIQTIPHNLYASFKLSWLPLTVD